MKKRGFTIIEVVLVLAIAGLIFLMVFIALPALQRSQRNTRRRQDMARISTAFTQYLSSNSQLPAKGDGSSRQFDYSFVPHYIDENVVSASGKTGFDSLKQGKTDFSCPDGKTCDQFSDPDGSVYNFYYGGVGDVGISTAGAFLTDDNVSGNFANHNIYLVLAASCSGNSSGSYFVTSGGANAFAMAYILEGNAIYCVDNS